MPTSEALKIVFAGTPEFAAQHLSALLGSKHQIVCAYTQPDRPAGRGKKLAASAVKQVAQAAGLPVRQPLNFKSPEALDELAQWQADLMVVVAYGLLLPNAVLELPRLGCINVHASLLPRWRGAAPIQRAIEAGDAETGITIMQMDAGLDTGAMLHKVYCPVLAEDTAQSLHDRLASLGPDALLQTLEQLAAGSVQAETQDNTQATYAHKLDKQEALIDWQQPAPLIERRVRAFNPFPVAYTTFDQQRLRVFSAAAVTQPHDASPGTVLSVTPTLTVACGGNTALQLEQVQLPGKKAMSAQAVVNGAAQKWAPGVRLGVDPT